MKMTEDLKKAQANMAIGSLPSGGFWGTTSATWPPSFSTMRKRCRG